MASRSAGVAATRPFYALHAEAYDALITDPVEPWVRAVHDRLVRHGAPCARILDVGCGTGRHARALMGLGHHVSLLDASGPLLEIARRRCPGAPAHRADICAPGLAETFDAITSRGVLNDLVADGERATALASCSRLLEPGGLLLLDVREAQWSRERADGLERRTEVTLPGGRILAFMSRPTWQQERGLIEVAERYELTDTRTGECTINEYRFRMRPWSAEELRRRLVAADFEDIKLHRGVGRRTPDRLLVTARRQ